MKMFLRDYALRPSCYRCTAKLVKTSDLTIADFWGIEGVAPEMDDGMGTSLVIVRTQKGQALFDEVADSLTVREVTYEEGIRKNPAEYRSAERPKERGAFYTDLNGLPFEKMIGKYAGDKKKGSKKLIARLRGIKRRLLRGKR